MPKRTQKQIDPFFAPRYYSNLSPEEEREAKIRSLSARQNALKAEKKNALIVARDLFYNKYMPDIEERIKAAKTEMEINRILATARKLWIEKSA